MYEKFFKTLDVFFQIVFHKDSATTIKNTDFIELKFQEYLFTIIIY